MMRSVNSRDVLRDTYLRVCRGSTSSCVHVIVTIHVILLGGVEVFIVFNFLHWLCRVAAVA